MAVNGASVDATTVPTGTSHTEPDILAKLKACNARNFDTLADVALSGLKGEPLDDKTYLMERIIQLTADLPLHDRMSDTLTNSFLYELWHDLEHPSNSYLGYDFVFRKADGSNNNILWPQIGAAGQPYARSVRAKRMQPPRPDPEVVYDAVLRRKEFKPHPNNISSVLFYVASIIIHDCFHTSHEDYAISETSSYLDLSPLYGSSQKDQDRMRTHKDGKLKADCFSDNRIMGFPPGVGAMLIFFNRFHNHVVENLAKIDEGGRFSPILRGGRTTGLSGYVPKKAATATNGTTPLKADQEATPEQLYDEALFQTGRLITTGLYINIILQDYVRTILGLNHVDSLWNLDPRQDYGHGLKPKKIPSAQGNQVSAEFSLVYRWHSCVSERDDEWTQKFLKKMMTDPKLSEGEMKNASFLKKAAKWADDLKSKDPQDRDFEGLKREGPDGRFSDDDLHDIWAAAVEDKAGAFGANHVPPSLEFVEVLSMLQSRSWNLASLNEFREYFKLQPHKTFESINPDPKVYKALEKLYGHPDNVEIYPGIVVESAKKAMDPGSGLCASWTTSRAILADAVSLVRSDRFYTVDYTPTNLTNWGFQAASYDLDINHGCVFYKLILNALPNHVKKNSVYAHYPLVNPDANKKILEKIGRAEMYSWTKPTPRAKTLPVKEATDWTDKALSSSTAFTASWQGEAKMLKATIPIQPSSKPKMTFAEAVMADAGWQDVTKKFYSEKLAKLWQEKQYQLGDHSEVDIVGDVLNPAHAYFVTSVLGIPMPSSDKHDEPNSLLGTLGHLFQHIFTTSNQTTGLSSRFQKATHWLVDGITSALHGSDAKEGDLGRKALARLREANGSKDKEITWQDILPSAALLLTTLCRSTAGVVHKDVPQALSKFGPPPAAATAAAPKLEQSTIALTANVSDGNVQQGQRVVIDMSKVDANNAAPEIKFAQQVAAIANSALSGEIAKHKGLERVAGPPGTIKEVVSSNGEVRYMNTTWSDYVPHPANLKVRWK